MTSDIFPVGVVLCGWAIEQNMATFSELSFHFITLMTEVGGVPEQMNQLETFSNLWNFKHSRSKKHTTQKNVCTRMHSFDLFPSPSVCHSHHKMDQASLSVFAYCKQSKTGQLEGLGTKLPSSRFTSFSASLLFLQENAAMAKQLSLIEDKISRAEAERRWDSR